MKQEALAIAVGVSQQTVSNIENSETVEDDKLQLIAIELGVSVEAIRNFSEEGMISYFNTFNDNSFSNSQGTFYPNNCTFNPIDKLVQVYEEKEKLYERLLQAEKDKMRIWKISGKIAETFGSLFLVRCVNVCFGKLRIFEG